MVIIEDFIIGFIFGQVTMFAIDFWSIGLGLITGILFVAGGQGYLGTKLWRRIGVPLAICIPFSLNGNVLGAVISFFLQFGVQCIGYGEPSTQPPDEGSWLGRKFGRFTRLVWFLLLTIAMIPLFL